MAFGLVFAILSYGLDMMIQSKKGKTIKGKALTAVPHAGKVVDSRGKRSEQSVKIKGGEIDSAFWLLLYLL